MMTHHPPACGLSHYSIMTARGAAGAPPQQRMLLMHRLHQHTTRGRD
jgi:hypothetical protein